MNTRLLVSVLMLIALALAGCGRRSDAERDEPGDEHSRMEDAEHGGDEHAEDEHAGPHEEGREDERSGPKRTTLPEEIATEVGIKTAAVGAGVIRDAHDVQGLLTPVEGKHARIRARFPGIVRAVSVSVGDRVTAGQTLATIESNTSLTDYSVTAPFAGTVLGRFAAAGDLAGDDPLFELADLSTLWVDLHLFGADAQHISAGLPVEVMRLSDESVATTKLDRILPGTATASQSTIARALIRNHDGRWRPGTAVRARVTVSERQAQLVVPHSAIQLLDGQSVVFVRSGDNYTARAVRLGERDADRAEVLDGLESGEEIVVEQSYVIKADIEKAGAAHEH
jgi:cobalt-zinc-cadmium efflux system membrane fusion protein